MPPIDETPSALRAVAAHLRDACDGPLDGDTACDRAAAIVEAVGDPWFLEALMTHRFILSEAGAASESGGGLEARYRSRAEAIGRVLAAVETGGGR